jgi:hypothetical protein
VDAFEDPGNDRVFRNIEWFCVMSRSSQGDSYSSQCWSCDPAVSNDIGIEGNFVVGPVVGFARQLATPDSRVSREQTPKQCFPTLDFEQPDRQPIQPGEVVDGLQFVDLLLRWLTEFFVAHLKEHLVHLGNSSFLQDDIDGGGFSHG